MVILPLNDQEEIKKYSENLHKELLFNNLRGKIWSEKTLNYRIRQVYKKKIPYYLIIGEKEVSEESLAVLHTYSGKTKSLTKENLIKELREENKVNYKQ